MIAQTCRAIILIGKDAAQIKNCLPENVLVLQADTLKTAVKLAYEAALPGDRVLLSPACASFDMFAGFEDRGNQFIKAVQELSA